MLPVDYLKIRLKLNFIENVGGIFGGFGLSLSFLGWK
jgi:hypothetical protein